MTGYAASIGFAPRSAFDACRESASRVMRAQMTPTATTSMPPFVGSAMSAASACGPARTAASAPFPPHSSSITLW